MEEVIKINNGYLRPDGNPLTSGLKVLVNKFDLSHNTTLFLIFQEIFIIFLIKLKIINVFDKILRSDIKNFYRKECFYHEF